MADRHLKNRLRKFYVRLFLLGFRCIVSDRDRGVFWLLLKLSEAAGYVAAAAGAAAGAAAAGGSMTSRHQQTPLIGLRYVGAVIMSFGCFALIFAFVVFCEARDHAIEYYIRSKVYASSARGPRHCRLPFRHNVIDVILATAKRRADRKARHRTSPSLTAIVSGSSPEEVASAVERGNETVEDASFKVHRQPTLLPVSVTIDRTTDWLLSNGMHIESVPSSCLNRSHLDTVQRSQLDSEQSQIILSSERLLGNGMLRTKSSRHWTTDSNHDRSELDDVRLKPSDHGQDLSADLLLSNGTLRELLPERYGGISAGISDHLADSIWDEISVERVGWRENGKPAEVAPLMTAVSLSDDDTTPETTEPETASMTHDKQSEVAAASPSLSTSSSSVMFDFRMFSEVDQPKTTTPDLNEDVSDTAEEQSSPAQTATDSPDSSPSESPDLGGRSSPLAGSNDDGEGGRHPKRPCRLPLAERGTASPTCLAADRASSGLRQNKREQETVGRYHVGIHCPPPLPPPPTSPAVVAPAGWSPRRHTDKHY